MRKLLCIAAVIIACTSCRQIHGSGNIVNEKRQVSDFTGIDAGSAFEVEVRSGATSVEVEADDNLVKYIETRVSGGKLNIEFKKNYGLSNAHLKVFVSAPSLKSIKSSGAANIKVLDPLKNSEKITLESSGAGNIKAEVDAPEVEAEASGAGTVEVTGRTRTFRATSSGAGNIKAKELLSENTNAKSSGAGNVHVYASVSLTADASGAGNIFYSGGGTVNSHASGAGAVKKEN